MTAKLPLPEQEVGALDEVVAIGVAVLVSGGRERRQIVRLPRRKVGAVDDGK
jgi:hypothetical protein